MRRKGGKPFLKQYSIQAICNPIPPQPALRTLSTLLRVGMQARRWRRGRRAATAARRWSSASAAAVCRPSWRRAAAWRWRLSSWTLWWWTWRDNTLRCLRGTICR